MPSDVPFPARSTKSYGDLENDPRLPVWNPSKSKHTASHSGRYLGRLRKLLPNWSTKTDLRGGSSKVWQSRKSLSKRVPTWRFILVLLLIVVLAICNTPSVVHRYRRSLRGGGGARFVVILAANHGGGVMDWKGPREWAIERDSIRNKRNYVERWGYDLEVVDMTIKKRYAHEWRESWEKVDILRRCLHDYPDAEWFWWLDLNTLIMEPGYSLQSHIFNNLGKHAYRDINTYNPLNITHPPDLDWLDDLSKSPDGDGDAQSINLLITQDCGGFNLGSFFVRRSEWTRRLLDVWWDPVHYEQRHMQWEHKEQDVLEHLYKSQPWIRPHTGFLPQRMINSFPSGACGENEENIHYREEDRDFLVNMAGCEWGRDCWQEIFDFRELSRKLNRTWWDRLKTWLKHSS